MYAHMHVAALASKLLRHIQENKKYRQTYRQVSKPLPAVNGSSCLEIEISDFQIGVHGPKFGKCEGSVRHNLERLFEDLQAYFFSRVNTVHASMMTLLE